VATAEETRRRVSTTFDFSLGELQRFIKDTSNDDAEPSRSEPFRDERPTKMIDLLENALENDREW